MGEKQGMGESPRISEAEWRVMKVFWAKAPQTANDVVDALEKTSDWSPKTVKTLINRLVKKGALGFTKEGRTYQYFPEAKEAACVRAESRSFLRRVYGGAIKPMLATFIEHEDLTPDDIAELKRLLDKKGRK
jgi:BlaI family transcriptional regulator, penicillinase repressor